MQDVLTQKVFEAARQGRLTLAGWPDFDGLVTRMQALKDDESTLGSVDLRSSVVVSGKLMLLASVANKFLEMQPEIVEEAKEIIRAHSDKYGDGDSDYLYDDKFLGNTMVLLALYYFFKFLNVVTSSSALRALSGRQTPTTPTLMPS